MTRNAPDGGIVYDDRDDDDGLPEVAIPSADAIQWNDAASEQHATKQARPRLREVMARTTAAWRWERSAETAAAATAAAESALDAVISAERRLAWRSASWTTG